MLLVPSQHWGLHWAKHLERNKPMQVACVYGWHPVMDFLAGSPIPKGVSDYSAFDWAIAYRVRPGTDDIVVFPGSFGSPIDPSTPLELRSVVDLGAGVWNRMLIDATKAWRYSTRSEWGGEKFPPTVAEVSEASRALTPALTTVSVVKAGGARGSTRGAPCRHRWPAGRRRRGRRRGTRPAPPRDSRPPAERAAGAGRCPWW